ncbi:MAG: recombinase family protein [Eubacteriales bacterium]
MKKCVIYARYSSERQTEQSIEGQLRVCYEFAKQNELTVVREYIDRAMTGTNDLRKEFQQMLSDSEKTMEWDICLVYALDRFGRNSIEQAINKYKLQKTGKIVISATQRTSRNIDGSQNLDGIILENMYVGMAEYYSAELSQKVKRGMNETRQKGNFPGGYTPFGYFVDGDKKSGRKVRIDEDQAAIVRKIYEDYAAGRLVTDILAELHEKGILNRGQPFARNTLYKLLKNEKYVGIFRHDGEAFTNIYPPIVSQTTFDIVRAKVENNKYGKHKADVEYLLKFKVTCGYCGKPVNSDAGTSKTGTIMRYYKCAGKRTDKSCPHKPIRKEVLEQVVIDAVYKTLATPDLIEEIADRIMAAHKKRMDDQSILNILEERLAEKQTAISNLIAAMEQGILSSSTKDRLNQLENEKAELSNKIAVEKMKNTLLIQRNDIVKYLQTAIKKRPLQMIQLLIKKVVLYNDRIDIHLNYTDGKRPDDELHQVFCFYSFEQHLTIGSHKYSKEPIDMDYTVAMYI